jgi:hypothetical protein
METMMAPPRTQAKGRSRRDSFFGSAFSGPTVRTDHPDPEYEWRTRMLMLPTFPRNIKCLIEAQFLDVEAARCKPASFAEDDVNQCGRTVAINYLEAPGVPGQRLSHGGAELCSACRSEFAKQIGLERKAAAAQSKRKTREGWTGSQLRAVLRIAPNKGDSVFLTHQPSECLVRLGCEGRAVVHAEDVKRELE